VTRTELGVVTGIVVDAGGTVVVGAVVVDEARADDEVLVERVVDGGGFVSRFPLLHAATSIMRATASNRRMSGS
jgi:hypothetical protein